MPRTGGAANSRAVVARLFARMEGLYGNKFNDAWRDCDLDSVKSVWEEALEGYSIEEITRGVQALLSREWPPTCPEFLKLCRPPVNYRGAYHEAMTQMQMRKDGRDSWSHPAVYWAAAAIGSHDLNSSNWQQIESRWAAALDAELAKRQWPPVPMKLEELPAPGRTTLSAAEVKRNLAVMREILGRGIGLELPYNPNNRIAETDR